MKAVVRVRGDVNLSPGVRTALKLLNLTRVNHMVFLPELDTDKGQIEKVKDYITYGEVSKEVAEKALLKRGRTKGNKKLDENYLKERKTTVKEMVNLLFEGKKKLSDFGVKPVLRLHPPKKGYEKKGIKQPFSIGGALGNRKEEINRLILRMI